MQRARYIVWTLTAIAMLILPVLASAATFPNFDGELVDAYTATGRYGIVSSGVGLNGVTSGSIDLFVPGTPVKVYLYWAGYDVSSGSDDEVAISNGTNTYNVTADTTYGPSYWWGSNHYHYVFVEDITGLNIAQAGSGAYTISNVDMDFNYGAGIIVVYEDENLDETTVWLLEGLDSIHFRFGVAQSVNRGSPSALNCFTFEADAENPRLLEFTTFTGGYDTAYSGQFRANRLWYKTGYGAPPAQGTDLTSDPDAAHFGNPTFQGDANGDLIANDLGEWDTYNNQIVIEPWETWACLQIESVATYDPQLGVSLLWLMAGASLREPSTPTSVDLTRFEALPDEGGIAIEWETASEVNTLGFNLYRSQAVDGEYNALNQGLIPAQGLGAVGGHSYTYVDTGLEPGKRYFYKLESVSAQQANVIHGPVDAAAPDTTPTSVTLTALSATAMPNILAG
ncbi:MAG: hypothetical protein JXB35_02905, partial [Anaerolineae bacterium]|nr:hypothetical protein [Anaerolineae bacterium]